jgi:uncharacterized spore protein YtfJ
MAENAVLQSLKELVERNLGIRHVYGEPVVSGDTTVIPVASAQFAFGGGEGQTEKQQGGGGGGWVQMVPVGTLEIGPRGTRFVRFPRWGPLLGAAAAGFAAALLLARLRR